MKTRKIYETARASEVLPHFKYQDRQLEGIAFELERARTKDLESG
jgi:hypothetical protein